MLGVREKRGLNIALFSTAIDLLGLSIMLPVLPAIAADFNASSLIVGVMFTCYALAQTISNPITGKLSDKWGRRPVILLSLFGSALGFLLQAISPSIEYFLIARFTAGLFGSTPPVAKAYIADVVPIKNRPKYYSMLSATIGCMFAIGPAIGGFLSSFVLKAPFYTASLLSFIGLIGAFRFFEEPVKQSELTKSESSGVSAEDGGAGVELDAQVVVGDAATVGGTAAVGGATETSTDDEDADNTVVGDGGETVSTIAAAAAGGGGGAVNDNEVLIECSTHDEEEIVVEVSNAEDTTTTTTSSSSTIEKPEKANNTVAPNKPMPEVLFPLFISQFMVMAAFTGYLTVFPLILQDKYGYGSLATGLFFTYVSFVFVTVQLKFFAPLVKRFGKHFIGMVGSFCLGLGLLLIPLATVSDDANYGVAFLIPALLSMGLGFGFISPAIPSLISRYADPKEMGRAIGTADAFESSSRIIMPLILTYTYESVGRTYPFLIAGGLGWIPAIILIFLFKHNAKMKRLDQQEFELSSTSPVNRGVVKGGSLQVV